MIVRLVDNNDIEVNSILGGYSIVQGEDRDCLTFIFPSSVGLDYINKAFSSSNCESITVIEDNGTEHVHTGYVIRVSLTLVGSSDDSTIEVKMAKRSYAEEQLLSIKNNTEGIPDKITDIQVALCELYEMMNPSTQEETDNG